ncbi:MAG: ankyrin repeat domain-containing protein [Acidimicrobiia bacterium]
MADVWSRRGLAGFTADEVRAALAAGGDPNVRLHNIRNTPLHDVLRSQDPSPEAVELLIGAGADVEAVNEAGETPLWCAVRRPPRSDARPTGSGRRPVADRPGRPVGRTGGARRAAGRPVRRSARCTCAHRRRASPPG